MRAQALTGWDLALEHQQLARVSQVDFGRFSLFSSDQLQIHVEEKAEIAGCWLRSGIYSFFQMWITLSYGNRSGPKKQQKLQRLGDAECRGCGLPAAGCRDLGLQASRRSGSNGSKFEPKTRQGNETNSGQNSIVPVTFP